MSIINLIKQFLKWLKPALNQFAIILIVLLVELLLLRLFELFYFNNISLLNFFLKGTYYDLILLSIIALVLILPFIALFKIARKTGLISFYILNVIIVLSNLLLIDYLKINSIPLDHAFFAYPINEIFYIIHKSININFLFISKYIIALIFSIYLPYAFFKQISSRKIYWLSILLAILGLFSIRNSNPNRRDFSNDSEYNFSLNKLSFFSKSSIKYFSGSEDISKVEYINIIKAYQKSHPEYKFTSNQYPFEHTPDKSDVLGPFFNLSETPPNIVLIVMESLSGAFCGHNAYLGNFTPFLDSLINHSLYWENFLSTSERTFNALPSLTGSLPYGEKGFMNYIQDDSKVKHNTIIQFLNKNSYHTNFFYGGWIGFDNMGKFLKYQHTDFILRHFGEKYDIIEKNEKGFSWGYPDHALYERSLEVIDSLNTNPRLDIYLTISLHHPFKPPHKSYYDSLFTARLNALDLSKDQKEETRKYKHALATALYTDDALKSFFTKYKKRIDFKNTIFIITGDHRIGAHNTKNQIDIYHVPFIIYSPLLKGAEVFSSVSSHANLSNTLYNFFGKNYNFDIPAVSHCLGKSIDTCKTFQNIHRIPFMRTSRDITDYLSKQYFISNNELFELKDDLKLIKIQNKELLDSLKNDLDRFKTLNLYTVENNLISSHE